MRLTQLERQLLRYQGIPAKDVARACGCTIDQVLDGWHSLKDRGVMAGGPAHQGRVAEQLSFTQIDRMMRGNRAPVEPVNPEIGWTPETEGSW
jgi:hypothetical protein